MSEKDIDKAINESVANVETEETYHNEEEINEIKESIMKNKTSHSFLKRLVELHKAKNKEEYNEKRLR
ncbi:MAG: hypothetical protein PHI05_01565 [Bacilli bacterium]|nr:hypothetical protein [Bacilli bacterium]MDD4547415.1 hypothetical protein [Bacilli bacterium]